MSPKDYLFSLLHWDNCFVVYQVSDSIGCTHMRRKCHLMRDPQINTFPLLSQTLQALVFLLQEVFLPQLPYVLLKGSEQLILVLCTSLDKLIIRYTCRFHRLLNSFLKLPLFFLFPFIFSFPPLFKLFLSFLNNYLSLFTFSAFLRLMLSSIISTILSLFSLRVSPNTWIFCCPKSISLSLRNTEKSFLLWKSCTIDTW